MFGDKSPLPWVQSAPNKMRIDQDIRPLWWHADTSPAVLLTLPWLLFPCVHQGLAGIHPCVQMLTVLTSSLKLFITILTRISPSWDTVSYCVVFIWQACQWKTFSSRSHVPVSGNIKQMVTSCTCWMWANGHETAWTFPTRDGVTGCPDTYGKRYSVRRNQRVLVGFLDTVLKDRKNTHLLP